MALLPRDVPVGMSSLTSMCTSGGCAAKYDGSLLNALIDAIPRAVTPDLLVGLDPMDDAAVLRVDDTAALVFSVDFFPPIVDDPGDFGRIAANNALNDIYAMGGSPRLALSVAAFPEDMAVEIAAAVVKGAALQCRLSGAVLAGGHTIRDAEPKFGLAVAGFVNPGAVWLKSGARPGDELLLTKPLGSGLVVTGHRQRLTTPADLQAATECMLISNATAATILQRHEPTAVTDVTGFGLLGHAAEMALTSGVCLVIELSRLPVVAGARELAAAGVRTSGHRRNWDLVCEAMTGAESVDEVELAIALDPQTAGGLLIAASSGEAVVIERSLRHVGVNVASIGRVQEGSGVLVTT